jgi:peptidoglycan/LPS O-acetylase OafA/YrhL
MDALAAGAILAVVARQPEGLSRMASGARKLLAFTVFVIALVCVWRGGLDQHDVVVVTIGHTLLVCLFASLIVIALTSSQSDRVQRWLTRRSLTFLGQYSYAIYVFHYPVLSVRPSWLAPASVPTIFGSHLPGLLSYIVGATLVSIALALISWHLCEKQFLKLKGFFPYHSGQTAVLSASTLETSGEAAAQYVSSVVVGVGVIEDGQ